MKRSNILSRIGSGFLALTMVLQASAVGFASEKSATMETDDSLVLPELIQSVETSELSVFHQEECAVETAEVEPVSYNRALQAVISSETLSSTTSEELSYEDFRLAFFDSMSPLPQGNTPTTYQN